VAHEENGRRKERLLPWNPHATYDGTIKRKKEKPGKAYQDRALCAVANVVRMAEGRQEILLGLVRERGIIIEPTRRK